MWYIAKHSHREYPNGSYTITYDDLKRMYEENLLRKQECKQVTESSYRGESYYKNDGRPGNKKAPDFMQAFFQEILYRDPKTSGLIREYPHGIVISQGERGSAYRGERQIYTRSTTTLSRSLEKFETEKDKRLYRIVAEMRIAEFRFFLRNFDRVACWEEKGLSVLWEPLAQHYGLETDWLDITNDFNTAIFFATCRWDNGSRRWLPLTKEQTERNEDTRYGVLFHAPAENVMLDNMSCAYKAWRNNNYEGIILPIGYQPFMRCHSQYGYGLYMKEPAPLQGNPTFEELHFLHSEKLSEAVYELMDCGRKIYPQEGIGKFRDIIDSISIATSFSEDAFQQVLQANGWTDQADKFRLDLSQFKICGVPISISGDSHPFRVSRQRIRSANRKDRNFSIEKEYGIQLLYRKMLYELEN